MFISADVRALVWHAEYEMALPQWAFFVRARKSDMRRGAYVEDSHRWQSRCGNRKRWNLDGIVRGRYSQFSTAETAPVRWCCWNDVRCSSPPSS